MVARLLKLVAAVVLCSLAMLLPYRPRLLYGRFLAWGAHAPFILFGRLARSLLRELGYPR